MEAGRTPDTMVVDEPVTIDGWSPRNFEAELSGPDHPADTPWPSRSTPSPRAWPTRSAAQPWPPTAHRLGIVSPINTDPAMALGTTLVTPLEMAQAYDAFSNGGNRVARLWHRAHPHGRRPGDLSQHRPPATIPAIANPPLSELDQMLRTVVASGTGARAAIPGYDLAGKTGTTSDYKDAWFCGFTGGLTTVVWMGRDDNAPMRGITGGTAPAELWHTFMVRALQRLPVTAIPYGPAAPAPVTPVSGVPTPFGPAPVGPAPVPPRSSTPADMGFSPPSIPD